jgi:uncharacterized membrane protein YqgA involved in biofilm formation
MQGTLINAAAVIVGSTLGLIVQSRLPKKITKITFQGIGLFTLFMGIQMALKTNQVLLMVFSIVLGSIIGELLNIEKHLNKIGEFIKSKTPAKTATFSEGFITAFLLFCMGSMSILGSIEDGLGHEPTLLLAKSVLDGFSSLALAATLGIGVLFSVFPLLIFQGGITLFAAYITNFLGNSIIVELSAVGGLLLIGLAINILEIKHIKVTNMLPSLLVILILGYFFM